MRPKREPFGGIQHCHLVSIRVHHAERAIGLVDDRRNGKVREFYIGPLILLAGRPFDRSPGIRPLIERAKVERHRFGHGPAFVDELKPSDRNELSVTHHLVTGKFIDVPADANDIPDFQSQETGIEQTDCVGGVTHANKHVAPDTVACRGCRIAKNESVSSSRKRYDSWRDDHLSHHFECLAHGCVGRSMKRRRL